MLGNFTLFQSSVLVVFTSTGKMESATELKLPPATFKSKTWKHFEFRTIDKDGFKYINMYLTCTLSTTRVGMKWVATTQNTIRLEKTLNAITANVLLYCYELSTKH